MKWDLLNCSRSALARLTLTWDVLKWQNITISGQCYMININMRCIEIAIYDFFATDKYRLTLTWDVLKWISWYLFYSLLND